jgi:hypothetical protein
VEASARAIINSPNFSRGLCSDRPGIRSVDQYNVFIVLDFRCRPALVMQRQCAALKAAGCTINFTERLSGKTTRNRPQLARALARLRAGDVFVVAEWDRATRSMM